MRHWGAMWGGRSAIKEEVDSEWPRFMHEFCSTWHSVTSKFGSNRQMILGSGLDCSRDSYGCKGWFLHEKRGFIMPWHAVWLAGRLTKQLFSGVVWEAGARERRCTVMLPIRGRRWNLSWEWKTARQLVVCRECTGGRGHKNWKTAGSRWKTREAGMSQKGSEEGKLKTINPS